MAARRWSSRETRPRRDGNGVNRNQTKSVGRRVCEQRKHASLEQRKGEPKEPGAGHIHSVIPTADARLSAS